LSILSVLFPNRCPYCNEIIKTNETECSECRDKFPSVLYIKKLDIGNTCVSAFIYDGAVRDAIHSLKFRNGTFNAKSFSKQMYRAVGMACKCENIDIVTAVPMYKASKRERGYNQAELLARETARLLGKPYKELLKKTKKNRVQHELSGEQRKKNVLGVYSVKDAEIIKGKSILLVDDVCTTGSTLSECSRVIFECSPSDVLCVCAAETKMDL